jgi:hypothetical protein
MKMAYEDLQAMENGATAPLPYCDPLGLSTKIDDQELQKYREAEVKHGRVAMLAALGTLVQENFHPFFGTEGQDIGPSIDHLQRASVGFPALPIVLVAGIAAVEFLTINKGWSKQDYKEEGLGAGFVANLKEDYFPGDLGFDPLKIYPQNPAERTSMRNKELNNGRLAMISIWGMWVQELVDHETIGQHFREHGLGPASSQVPLDQIADVANTASQSIQ